MKQDFLKFWKKYYHLIYYIKNMFGIPQDYDYYDVDINLDLDMIS